MGWNDVKAWASDRQIEYANKLQIKNHGEILVNVRDLTYKEADFLIQRELELQTELSKRGE